MLGASPGEGYYANCMIENDHFYILRGFKPFVIDLHCLSQNTHILDPTIPSSHLNGINIEDQRFHFNVFCQEILNPEFWRKMLLLVNQSVMTVLHFKPIKGRYFFCTSWMFLGRKKKYFSLTKRCSHHAKIFFYVKINKQNMVRFDLILTRLIFSGLWTTN